MKKHVYLLICVLCCFMFACSLHQDAVNSPMYESGYNEIVDSGKHYRIYKGNITQVMYNIYDANGKIVLSDTTDRPLRINMLSDDIVDIGIDMGTGITVHKYYDVEKNVFSQDFSYVISISDRLVAYIDAAEERPLENRKVIVQNIFDKSLFYKEFQLDFSNVDTPVVEAKFSEDGLLLQLTYLAGDKHVIISKTLNLKTGDGSVVP